MLLSSDGHLWLRNIGDKCREVRLLLTTYQGHDIARALDHLSHVEIFAKHFIEDLESKLPGGLNGKAHNNEAQESTEV